MLKRVEAGQLEIAYEESGSIEGKTIVLLHGFPYDVRAYDDVAAILADAGCHVIVPYGISTMRPTNARQSHSTILTLLTW